MAVYWDDLEQTVLKGQGDIEILDSFGHNAGEKLIYYHGSSNSAF